MTIGSRVSVLAVGAAVLLDAGVAVWGWTLYPERAGRWLFLALLVPGMWLFVELAQDRGRGGRDAARIMSWHRWVFAAMGVILIAKPAHGLAVATGILDSGWKETVDRATGVLFGVGLAVWGNYLPTLLSPWRVEDEPFDWQRVHRFAGRIAFLSGLALVIVSLWLPAERLTIARVWIVSVLAMLVGGRKLLSVATYGRGVRRGSL